MTALEEATSEDVLVAGARRTVPRWIAVVVAALAVVCWGVVVAPGDVVDGHGSRPVTPVHGQYQPVLGRPLF